MKTLLLAFALLAQAPSSLVPLKEAVRDFPRSQLQVKSGPVTTELKNGSRAGYETLATIAGLNIIFDADYRDTPIPPLRIDSPDVLSAFDVLSMTTGNFVEVVASRTIVVAPNNATKRRDYEMQVLKTFYLPSGTSQQELNDAVTRLRTIAQARWVATSSLSNAIVIRDTPDRIALAEQTLAAAKSIISTSPVGTNAVGHEFIQDGATIRDLTPSRVALQSVQTSPQSFRIDGDSRTAFENFAKDAGLNVVFDPDFRSVTVRFNVENVSLGGALDLLALQTRNFWEAIDNKTIIVAPDNQAKRRDYELQSARVFYFPNSLQQGLTEVITALRTVLNLRYLAQVSGAGAIVIRDKANTMALAEKVINDIVSPVGSFSSVPEIPTGAEMGPIFARRAARSLSTVLSELQPKTTGLLSFDFNLSAARSFEALADQAGVNIAFDRRFQDRPPMRFRVDGVDIFDALDYLSLQTGNMWEIGDSSTIIVGPDNPAAWQDLSRRISKTIVLTRFPQQYLIEISTALRTLFNFRQLDASGNTIAIVDTPYNIAIAERLVSDLDKPGGRIQ